MEVLLAGNTGYVTETFIEESFPECDVVVLGNEMLKSNRKKNILSRPFIKDEKELKEIFETYEFERIVYFSNYLTMHGRMTGELEQLRQILQLCKKNKEIRMLYLTGQESIYNITSGKTLLVSAAENVVMEYGNMYQINTKILRIPHLYSAVYTQDFFYKLFTEAEESGKIVFEESPEQNIYFVCMDDLAELLYKVYDNWGKERKEALDLYYDLLELKEPPMRILYLIVRQFNGILQVKDLMSRGISGKEIASKIGAAPFVASKYQAQAKYFEMNTLLDALNECAKTEEAVKQGRLNDRLGVELIIIKYSK